MSRPRTGDTFTVAPERAGDLAGERMLDEHPGSKQVPLDEGTYTIEEFWPYEPSAYIHEPMYVVCPAGDGSIEDDGIWVTAEALRSFLEARA